jgi:MFS family permease
LIISSAEAFRGPAGTAILPRILDKECYDFGLSLNSSLTSVMELIGLASAGAIIAFFGTQTAILIDAVTFFGSALIISFINTKEQRELRQKSDFKKYFEALKGGFIYIKSKPVIRNFVLLAAVANGLLVPLNSLMAPLVNDLLKQGEMMLSVISFSLTIGLAVGSAIYPYVAKKMKTKVIVFLSGITLSIYYLLFSICGYISEYAILVYAICILSSFITGVEFALLSSALNVQFIKQIDTEYLARAGAIMGAVCVGSIPVVSFLVGVMTSIITLSAIFYILSGVGLVLFVIILLKRVRFE